MLHAIKQRVFLMLSSLQVLRYRSLGIKIGKGCIISGSPKFSFCKRSQIVLHDHVVLHSNPRYNKMIRLPMEVAAITPEARIEFQSHCGLSGAKIVCAERIGIGEYTIVGPDALIYDAKEHEYSQEIGWLGRSRVSGKAITIGKRCYIGARSIILKGVSIGDDCIVSAGALVNRDMPPRHIAIGNPASIYPLPQHLMRGDSVANL